MKTWYVSLMTRFFISIGFVAICFIIFQFSRPPEPTPPSKEASATPLTESVPTTTDVVAMSTEQSTSSTTTTPETTEAAAPAESPTTVTLPTYSKETLARYNGEDPSLPIYIAFEGNVYDVTSGKKFYEPGGAYHFLAGTDGTLLLRTFGGDLIKQKYLVVGTYLD